MRIAGGTLRGRKIASPRGPHVQPMPDMVRKAVFAILQHLVPGARVLDLFACSGSVGIEALSRGASFAMFIERDPRAAAFIRKNLQSLGLFGSSEVLAQDVLTAAAYLKHGRRQFDLTFLDPPYALSQTPASLDAFIVELFKEDILAGDAVAVFRYRKGAGTPLARHPQFNVDVRTYGTSSVAFIERAFT